MSHVTDIRRIAKKERSNSLKSESNQNLRNDFNIEKSNNTSQTRNVTEKLRGNHIETLEVLQDITNENIELKRQLSRLKLKLSKLSNNNDEDSDGDNTEKSNENREVFTLSQMVEKDKEIKVLKSKLNSSEMEIRSLKLAPKILPHIAPPIIIKEMDNEDNNKLKEIYNDLDLKVGLLKEAYDKIEEQNKIILNLNSILIEKEKIISNSIILENQLKESFYTEINNLKEENEVSILKIKDDKELIGALNNELIRLQNLEKKNFKSEKRLLDNKNDYKRELLIEKEKYEKLKFDYDKSLSQIEEYESQGSTFQLTTSDLELKVYNLENSLKNINNNDKNVESEIVESESGFRFEEFIRLKKENKLLKLQLLEKRNLK